MRARLRLACTVLVLIPDGQAFRMNKQKYYELAHTVKEEITEQPTILVGGKLRDFQMTGLTWMVSLYNNNLNGVLADEMGLGKTIQVLSIEEFFCFESLTCCRADCLAAVVSVREEAQQGTASHHCPAGNDVELAQRV